MASKSAYQASEKGAEIEESLDDLDKLLERLRATYEQYFLGIAKTAPSTLFTEVERKIRDLTQIQIKNTALRYRFATLGQKFGAYSMYWKRTMRLIESGKYVRDLQRVQRQALKTGEAIPEEILAAMPKMMRERVARDRAAVLKAEARKNADAAAAPAPAPAVSQGPKHMHRLDDALVADDVDLESMFAALTKEAEEALDASPPIVRSRPPKMDTIPPIPPPPPQRAVPPPIPQRPSAPPAARTGIAPPAAVKPPAPPPGMNENETRSLFQKYLKARELCGESNDGVTYDKLVRTLRAQSSKIMSDARVKGVEFGVVIKDNKVILKAKPKAKP